MITKLTQKHLILTLLILQLGPLVSAQESKIIKVFEGIKLQAPTNSRPIDETILFKPGNEIFILKYAEPILSDTSVDMRMKGISVLARVAYKSTDTIFRQASAARLLAFFRDKDPGVAGRAAKYITGFDNTDFGDVAKDSIRSLIGSQCFQYDQLLKITGFAGVRDKVQEMKSQLLGGSMSSLMKWSSILALARMGEQEYISLCLITVKDMPVSDNMMYNTLPDLIYTRQREIFDFLIDLVQSDNENCHSPNPNYSGKILCAYRVMEALAGVIEDFPVKVKQSGDLVTDSYEKSLEITRKWLTEHKTDYKINTHKF